MISVKRSILSYVLIAAIVIMAMFFGASHAHAASIKTANISNGWYNWWKWNTDTDTINDTDYIKFKAPKSGAVRVNIYNEDLSAYFDDYEEDGEGEGEEDFEEMSLDPNATSKSDDMSLMWSCVYNHERLIHVNYKAYTKKNGKYKYLVSRTAGNCTDCGDDTYLFVKKGKTYYVKLADIPLEYSTDNASVHIILDSIPDGGSKKSTAKELKVDSIRLPAYMCYYDGPNDWFKFTLKKTTTVNIQLRNSWAPDKKANKASLTIYKGKKKIKTKKLNLNSGTKNTKIKLKKGKYYIKVRNKSKSANLGYLIFVGKKYDISHFDEEGD